MSAIKGHLHSSRKHDFCLMVGNQSAVRELEQTRRRRQRKRNLKMYLGVSAIIFQLFKVIMLAKCVPTILIQELIWNTKLNICHHMLRSSIQLQNRSFHVVERTRTSAKCLKMTNARAKRAELLFFIVKYANLGRSCCRPRRGFLRGVYTSEQKWHGSDKNWNGSNSFCKETVNFYPFRVGSIGV